MFHLSLQTTIISRRVSLLTMRWFVVIATVFAPTFAYSAPSDLDTGFGTNGTVTFAGAATSTLFGPASATLAALQPDGKLLVVVGVEQAISGASNPSKLSWQIRRYTIGGALDPAFGIGGIVTLSFDVDFNGFRGSDRPGGLARLPDGRFVVVRIAKADDEAPVKKNTDYVLSRKRRPSSGPNLARGMDAPLDLQVLGIA